MEKLDFRDAAPEVIDLSPEGGVVRQLKESMVECIVADKVRLTPSFRLIGSRASLLFTVTSVGLGLRSSGLRTVKGKGGSMCRELWAGAVRQRLLCR